MEKEIALLEKEKLANVDKEKALLFVCGAMVIIYFFRNLFRYFSLVFMLPVSNGIVRDIRERAFQLGRDGGFEFEWGEFLSYA